MSGGKKGFPELLDDAIDNPAFELLGGYHLFLRRFLIPLILAILFLFVYDLFDNVLFAAIITGLSVGPIINLERYLAIIKQRK
ncbi:MAG: hypothetical protein CMB15_02040 [Euryarchaeota archaeon]|nr:hypothetical protein [Euryarchaeota archaeon]|tara:strand:- start:64175 stop:64423 length:249 start_codon:yes stop_codon:yes gene_type:complete